MTKSQTPNKARQQLIDAFLACLNEETLPWRRGWNMTSINTMHNPVSKTRYRGVNAFILMLEAYEKGYEDPRWCTFKQAVDKGWHIKKDSDGVPVEFWSYYDKKKKKNISFGEYDSAIRKEERDSKEFRLVSRTYTVFNGECVEGIPALAKEGPEKLSAIEMNSFVENIKNNMEVGYREIGNKAYYSPSTDVVTMPPRESFINQYEFDSTLLHELSHATGHESRLNREIRNFFGTEKYAIEELRAEMSSAFLGQYMDIDMGPEHMNNHKAYIQSWARDLKEEPNILFRAIKDAENIADYLIEKGDMERIKGLEMEEAEEEQEKPSLDEKVEKARGQVKTGKSNRNKSKQLDVAPREPELQQK